MEAHIRQFIPGVKMKKIFVPLSIILGGVLIYAQPQLENNIDQVSQAAKIVVIGFIIAVIVIFGIGGAVINLKRGADRRQKLLNK